jgi:hemoglobin
MRITLITSLVMLIGLSGCGTGAGGQAREDRDFHTSGSRDADQRAEQMIAKDEQLKGKQAQGDSTADATKKDKKDTSPAADQQTAKAKEEKKSLYDRLGGEKGIRSIVDDFTTRALADPRVNWKRVGVTRGGINFKHNEPIEWKPDDAQINGMKFHIVQFLALATGGPSKYEGREMANVHKGMHITNAEFDATIGDFKATLDKLGVAKEEQKEVLAIIESTRPQVVEER